MTIRHRHSDAPLTFRATSQLWETKRETGKDVVIGFYKGEGRAVQTKRAGDGRLFIMFDNPPLLSYALLNKHQE